LKQQKKHCCIQTTLLIISLLEKEQQQKIGKEEMFMVQLSQNGKDLLKAILNQFSIKALKEILY
jgi:hypothetical protein